MLPRIDAEADGARASVVCVLHVGVARHMGREGRCPCMQAAGEEGGPRIQFGRL